jgi:hypothetical protein
VWWLVLGPSVLPVGRASERRYPLYLSARFPGVRMLLAQLYLAAEEQ